MTSRQNKFMTPPETITVSTRTVACDGGGPDLQQRGLGHPRVYLTIDTKTDTVECPYCDRCFTLDKG